MNILKNAVCTICNATGPAHLSIALGTPTVVIVGGGHFGSFVPYPEKLTPSHARFVYEEMSCYHCFWRCHKRASKFDVFPCVSAVSEEKVINSVLELIPRKPQTPIRLSKHMKCLFSWSSLRRYGVQTFLLFLSGQAIEHYLISKTTL